MKKLRKEISVKFNNILVVSADENKYENITAAISSSVRN
jgi:hypothetical protein